MTDRELLEFAAKAAGYGDVWSLDEHPDVTYIEAAGYGDVWSLDEHPDVTYIGPRYDGGTVRYRVWNPLTDDGDALRLAVKLLFEIDMGRGSVAVRHSSGIKVLEAFNHDPYAATRRAIVRAAAEIGRGMP